MNFELYIENLGAIEKAEITINPLTILAGENGTGKSFVTKFLYSVLNVLMRDVYRMELLDVLDNWQDAKEKLMGFLSDELVKIIGIFINETRIKISQSYNVLLEDFGRDIYRIKDLIDKYNSEMGRELQYIKEELKEARIRLDNDYNYTFDLLRKDTQIGVFELNTGAINYFYKLISNREFYFYKIMEKYITNELKDNFQISNIGQIIKKGQEKLIFEIKNIVKIEIIGDDLVVKDFQITNNLSKINRLTFFESPIYWRLSMELIENSSRPKNYYLSDKISDERLTGVPKYFLDLRELLFSRFEKGEKESFIEQCANDLQKNLNGKFNTDSYDLSFETNQGQTINKTLVSFGMTNLGILQAVLNKNIINKGSFVFIDEPESNLHPEWQAVLADILVKLAENGVFVVITTHSSDMLKALDVYSSNKEQNQFVSVNYFEKEGNLAIFDKSSVENVGVLSLVRNKLLEPYASFTFYKKGGFFDD